MHAVGRLSGRRLRTINHEDGSGQQQQHDDVRFGYFGVGLRETLLVGLAPRGDHTYHRSCHVEQRPLSTAFFTYLP